MTKYTIIRMTNYKYSSKKATAGTQERQTCPPHIPDVSVIGTCHALKFVLVNNDGFWKE